MRIATNTFVQSTVSRLQNLENQQQTVQNQLISGQRINSIEEDPTTAARILRDQQTQRQLIQYQENSTQAQGIAQAGYDSLEYLQDLSEQAQSIVDFNAFEDTDSAVFSVQINALIEDALRTANGQYNGDYLFAGTDTAQEPFSLSYTDNDGNAFLDADGNPIQRYVYNGNDSGREIAVADGVTISPYTDGDTNQSIADFLNAMLDYSDAVAAGDTAAIQDASNVVQDAEDVLVDGMSNLSMKQFRMETLESSNAAKYSALSDEVTALRAVDLNEATISMLNIQNAYSAALSTTSMVMDTTILNYI